MKFVVSLLVCGLLVAVDSAPQQYHYKHYYQLQVPASNEFFRQHQELDAAASAHQGRVFFATPTITLATSTVTTTSTSTTSCTTSTAALSACVASSSASSSSSSSSGKKRRKRNTGSSLFYREEDQIDESIFLPSPKVERAAEPEVPSSTETPAVFVPFVVQPGMMMARTEPQLRFLVAFTTATTTVTTSTTSVSTLTAICSSSTNFQLCGSRGK